MHGAVAGQVLGGLRDVEERRGAVVRLAAARQTGPVLAPAPAAIGAVLLHVARPTRDGAQNWPNFITIASRICDGFACRVSAASRGRAKLA